MKLLLPSMPELHAFLAVARTGSFSSAAQTLFVTQGGVSRCVQRLEGRLGTALFVRNGRGVSLTPTGQRLYEQIEPAMQTLANAIADIQSQAPPGNILRLRTVSTLASRWLIPRLPEFNERVPHVQVVVQPNALDDDFLSEDVDGWLYWRMSAGTPWPRHLRATYVIGRDIVPICHPSIVSSIKTPADLLRYPLLYHVEAPELWAKWCAVHDLPPPTALHSEFNIMAAAIDAVASNFGVVLLPSCLAEIDAQAGRIVILRDFIYPSRCGYYLCTAKTRDNDPTIAAFRDWLLECAISSDEAE